MLGNNDPVVFFVWSNAFFLTREGGVFEDKINTRGSGSRREAQRGKHRELDVLVLPCVVDALRVVYSLGSNGHKSFA